jgi:hypothetical protein
MGGAALGAPGEQIKEDEEEVAGTTFDEPDEELNGGLTRSPLGCAPAKPCLPEPAFPPPQPGTRVRGRAAGAGRTGGLRYTGGLSAKGLYAALSGLHGMPAPHRALRLASKPFALNAAPSDYLDTLLGASQKWNEKVRMVTTLPASARTTSI